jgi:hypothetical protein
VLENNINHILGSHLKNLSYWVENVFDEQPSFNKKFGKKFNFKIQNFKNTIYHEYKRILSYENCIFI